MKINFDTFTPEQKYLLQIGYKPKIIEGMISFEEPEEITQEIFEYKLGVIDKQFQDRIHHLSSGYTQIEKDTWNQKIQEAQKIINGEKSELLESLIIEGETVKDLAKKILTRALEYSKVYVKAEQIKRQETKNLEDKYFKTNQ